MSTASPDTWADVLGVATHRAASSSSRTSRPPHGGVAPGTPGNASRCRRRTRRCRHPLTPGAGGRGESDRGWPHPESRRRRPSCRRGRRRQPRRAHHGASCGTTSRPRRANKVPSRRAEVAAAVEDEDASNWEPRDAAIAAMTTSRPATTDPANSNPTGRCPCRLPWVTPPFNEAWCCQHVCGFRYAGDMPRL